jgi:hypothetical protein
VATATLASAVLEPSTEIAGNISGHPSNRQCYGRARILAGCRAGAEAVEVLSRQHEAPSPQATAAIQQAVERWEQLKDPRSPFGTDDWDTIIDQTQASAGAAAVGQQFANILI